MKKTLGTCLIGLAMALGAAAQTVPADLIHNLHVVGIQKWDIVNTNVAYVKHYPPGEGVRVLADALSKCGSADDTPCYLLKMTVSIDNTGTNSVLFANPELDVRLLQLDEKGEVLGTDIQGSELYKGNNTPLRPTRVDLGMARLVMSDQADWEDIANILGSVGSQNGRETQLQFEIVVGPKDLEHAQLMINAFNIMNDQSRRWELWLTGTAKVGAGDEKGGSSATVILPQPLEISLKSKPSMPPLLIFPK